MKRHFFAPALLLFFPPLLTGCHKDTIVGKWQGPVAGAGLTLTYEFTEDGHERSILQVSGTPVPAANDAKGMADTMSSSGTYTVSGATLTQNITVSHFGGTTSQVSEAQVGTWALDGDHLTLTDSKTKKPFKLTRIKD